MAFECRLLCVVRLSIFGRFVFLESAISIRFVWDFSEIWICGLYCASELNIFDLTGQMLLKQIDKCTIDTSYLKKGAYLALYKIDEKFHTGKFIVE